MNKKKFIRKLTSNLRAVKPVNYNISFLIWIFSAVIILGLSSFLSGFRKDILIQLTSLNFILESILLFLLSIVSAYTAFRTSIPYENKFKNYIFIILIFSWLCLILSRLTISILETGIYGLENKAGWHCVQTTTTISLP